MTDNTTPSGADALLQLIESYVEKRHTHGAPQYNVVTARARDAVLAALADMKSAGVQEDALEMQFRFGRHAVRKRVSRVYLENTKDMESVINQAAMECVHEMLPCVRKGLSD